MPCEASGKAPLVRTIDGREWYVGRPTEVAWIADATKPSPGVSAAIPPIFRAYCVVGLPESYEGAQRLHDAAVIALLREHSTEQPWWLGYLDMTGYGDQVVVPDAPRVKLYADWNYVLLRAGPDQALNWRQSEGRNAPWKGALPDLMFPTDHSWLLSTLWDDKWSYVGGPDRLITRFANDPELGSRIQLVAAN